MENQIKKQSTIIGVIAATIAALCYIAIWQYQMYQSGWMAIITLVTPLLMGILSQLLAKRKLKNAITLKQCVLAYFIVVVLFFVTEGVINYLIFVKIDPAAQTVVNEITAAVQQQNPNSAASSGVFKGLEFSFKSYLIATASKTLLYTALGILTGFFIKNVRTTS